MWLLILSMEFFGGNTNPVTTVVLNVSSKEECIYTAKLIMENAAEVKSIYDHQLTCRRPN